MTTARPTTARPGAVVFTLAFAGIVVALMQTLIIPIVGDLPKLLNTSASNATWAITVTLLAAAVATPTVGRLGDLYGKRPMLLISIVPLVGGSVLCAFSDSLLPMVIGRALQGLASGLIALGISALRDLMPPERLGSSVALISSSLGIGGALGLPLAAAIAQHSDWHVLFWVSAGLGLVSGLLILLFVPKTPRRAAAAGRSRFDFAGAVGLGAGLACLLLAISKGSDWGWTSGTTLGMLGGAVALLLIWGWWELRCKDPVVDLRTTARGQVLVTNLASVIVGFAMYAQQLIMPQLMELPRATGYGLGQSIQATGLWMMPGGLGMMLVSPIGAKLTARTNAKITLTVGAIVLAAGYGTAVGLMGHPWGLMIAALIASIGVGFGYGAMPALIMGGVPISETASANSFNTLMRSIGTTVSSAVIGVVLAHMTVTMGGVALPSRTGFRTGLLIGCGVAVVAGAVALAIPLNRASRGASAAEDARDAQDAQAPQAEQVLRDAQGAEVGAGSAAEAVAAPPPCTRRSPPSPPRRPTPPGSPPPPSTAASSPRTAGRSPARP
ncbi:MFS transporter [Phaeacidiphilus oryzae]|uniref:MFS transporter n=1 Tax=Phaeacidiphilus oryzae TaxID=348818 RepID=UPI0007C6D606|nr:MFS transporter [Phaeacidiphilus oryzae]